MFISNQTLLSFPKKAMNQITQERQTVLFNEADFTENICFIMNCSKKLLDEIFK